MDNVDLSDDFPSDCDSYGHESEKEDDGNFWEDVDDFNLMVMEDPFTQNPNLEKQQREMREGLANWAAAGNITRQQVKELLKLLRSNVGLQYILGQVNMTPYCLTFQRNIVKVNGPKKSIPTLEKEGR